MGTRNLTMVIKDKKPVVAQYGQWDGYPSGQGITVLNFLKNRSLNKFKKKLDLLRFATDEDQKTLDDFLESIGCKDGCMNLEQASKYHQRFPLLTRDIGDEILYLVLTLKTPTFIIDSSDFAKDSLFCEWGYVIDLDNETFEVYSGFNEKPLKKGERFYESKNDDGYYPISLVKKYSLNDLPSPRTFVKECDPPEEDDN